MDRKAEGMLHSGAVIKNTPGGTHHKRAHHHVRHLGQLVVQQGRGGMVCHLGKAGGATLSKEILFMPLENMSEQNLFLIFENASVFIHCFIIS